MRKGGGGDNDAEGKKGYRGTCTLTGTLRQGVWAQRCGVGGSSGACVVDSSGVDDGESEGLHPFFFPLSLHTLSAVPYLAPRKELLDLGHDAPRFFPAHLWHGCLG